LSEIFFEGKNARISGVKNDRFQGVVDGKTTGRGAMLIGSIALNPVAGINKKRDAICIPPFQSL
jgi:hypothetical protein